MPAASWFQRTFLIGGLLEGFFRDHDVQERMTQESGLDFVIARPTRLTNGKAKGKYVRAAEVVSVPAEARGAQDCALARARETD